MIELFRLTFFFSILSVLCAAGHARVAVFVERGFPYYNANELVSPRRICEHLNAMGVEAVPLSSASLSDPDSFSRDRVSVLVMVYGNTFPDMALPNLVAFRKAGGGLVAAGIPFTHPCVQEASGKRMVWRNLGPQDHTGPEGMSTGQVLFAPGAPQEYRLPEQDPLRLSALPVLKTRRPFRTSAVFRPETVAPRHVSSGLILGQGSGSVAVLIEPGDVGPTVLAGLGHFSDPRDPGDIIVQTQLLLRGVGWCLERAGQGLPDNFWTLGTVQTPDWNPSPPLACRPRPEKRLFPRPPRPRSRWVVLDLSGLSPTERLLAVSIQGIVNQTCPQVYLIHDRYDQEWLDWIQARGLTQAPDRLARIEDLVSRFRPNLAGAVVTSRRWVNIACMVASVEHLAIVSEDLLGRFDLPEVMDLRDFGWTQDIEGTAWAKEALWPRMGRCVLGHVNPGSSEMQRDFLIAQKAFLFWIPGSLDGSDEGQDPLASLLFAHQLLSQTPDRVPVAGWWGWGDPYEGIGEYWGMTLASRYGKLTPGTEFASNLSLLSALNVPDKLLKRRTPLRPGPDLTPDAAYVAMDILDSGDAVWYCQRRQKDVWEDPSRGAVPIGWSLTPSLLEFAPVIAAYYQEKATANDELMAACSGLLYCSLPEYGAAFENPRMIRQRYFQATGKAMRRLQMSSMIAYVDHWGAPTDFGEGGILSECARHTPGLKALFPDLGRPDCVTPANANESLKPGISVFHCLTRWKPFSLSSEVAERSLSQEAQWLLEEITQHTPDERPGFISAFPLSWTLPPSQIRSVAEALPRDRVPVLPSELAVLFQESQTRRTRPTP